MEKNKIEGEEKLKSKTSEAIDDLGKAVKGSARKVFDACVEQSVEVISEVFDQCLDKTKEKLKKERDIKDE